MENPKAKYAAAKVPIHLWPNTATVLGCLALYEGALKYGRSNYRVTDVKATNYYDAARRHLDAWFEGEDFDSDSGIDQLGHVLACLAILVDAKASNKLIDDRNYPGGYRKVVTESTPHVARAAELHKNKNEKQYDARDFKKTGGVVSIISDEDFGDEQPDFTPWSA